MKTLTKDLKTTTIALVIAILASASPMYGIHVLPSTPIAHAAAPAAPTILSGDCATGTITVQLTNPFLWASANCVVSKGNPAKLSAIDTGSDNILGSCSASTTTTITTGKTGGLTGAAKIDVEVAECSGLTGGHHETSHFLFPTSSGGTPTKDIVNDGPGSGQILVHEYTSTDLEMQAFQAGTLDLVDWDIPAAYLTAWNNCAGATPIGPNCNGQITTSKYSATDMYQIDLNENGSRVASQQGFRSAMGYLVDRQNIVLNIAGGFASPICSQASAGQEGSASCQSLGYPGPYGDYNPYKALEVLYESGWRYDSAVNFLYGPALPGGVAGTPCSATITGQTGNFCVRTITFMIRSDDPLRLGAGQAMASIMANLPNQFCTATSGNTNPIPPCPAGSTLTTVCPAAPCKLDVTTNVAAKPALAKIFQHAPWNRWDLYTGGWGLDLLVGDDLPFLYTSDFAPAPDCGLWQGDFPNNYGGFCNTAFDNAAHAVLTAPTISGADAAAVTAQQVGWGYSASAARISGSEPTIPMYSHLAYKAAWLKDVNSGLDTSGNPSTGSTTYAQRACWQNYIGNEVGVGLNVYETVIGTFDDNCGGNTAGHASFVTNPNAVLDWGFINPIEFLNIIQSTFIWDVQAMAQTYDTMLGRNPANPSELKPFLCLDYSIGTYFNTKNAAPATYYACHLRSDLFWSDGAPLTAKDIAFSTDYIAENQAPLYASNVANLCGPNGLTTASAAAYSPTNCGNGTQIVTNADGSQTIVFYYDSISAIFPLIMSLGNPVIPQHVFCNDWTAPAAGKLGPGVTATANCLFPDMGQLPDKAGLGCGVPSCPAFPGAYPNATAVPIPAYLSALGYGTTINNWLTGSGPYTIASCTGTGCANTILLKANPFWHDGVRMASPATGDVADATGLHGGLALQPDLTRSGFVNSASLAIAQGQLAAYPNSTSLADWSLSVDLRQGLTGTETITVDPSLCSGASCTTPTIAASFIGWPTTSTDIYIIQKLIAEGSRLGLANGITWPPQTGSVTNKGAYLPSGVVASLSYVWPDATVHDTVNVNDLVYVFLHQFVAVTDANGNLIPTSPYNADVTHNGAIDVHSLVTTLTREFSAPAGVNP
jgi:ABC-type transport system substrate-binding protein